MPTKDDIKSGQKWKLNNPAKADNGLILTVSHIETTQYGDVVKFSETAYKHYGVGVGYFLKNYELRE